MMHVFEEQFPEAGLALAELCRAGPRGNLALLKAWHGGIGGPFQATIFNGGRVSELAKRYRLHYSRQAWVEEKTGRNERCPCGSGKKFKKCCLD